MPFEFTAHLRIEKAGRGGKIVTLVEKLPRSYPFLENLARKLKTKCGSGGTYRLGLHDGIIEIQGDKRDQIRKIFLEEKIQFNG